MTTTMLVPRRKRAAPIVDMEHRARQAVAHHRHFRRRVDGFHFEQHGDVLTVRGRVPSFYLRDVLYAVLKRLDGVGAIDNQVDVVSCEGLSSVRSKR